MDNDLILQLDDGNDIILADDGGGDIDLVNSLPYYHQGTNDYEELNNKPTINGREIIGNKTLAYYLQDGLIIDGGDSSSYPEEVTV